MKNLSYLFVILSLIFINGCTHTNVYFFNKDKSSNAPKLPDPNLKNTVKLYIDAFGNLYPNSGYPDDFEPNNNLDANLYNQSIGNTKLCANIKSTSPQNDAYILCSRIKDETCDPNKPVCYASPAWRDAQTIIWKNAGERIFKRAASGKPKNLFFIIHGYNNSLSNGSIEMNRIVKERVEKITDKKEDFLYVEIYWDGFKGSLVSGAWGVAQASGALVGFHLRQLFKGIKTAYKNNKAVLPKLYVFTHSSGAFVIGSAFGNPYTAMPLLYNNDETKENFTLFRKNRDGKNETYPIPDFPETRVGMIAAATPTTTFTGAPPERRTDEKNSLYKTGGILSKNTTLIFSINKKDIALAKLFRIASFDWFGATGAGADIDLYCENLDNLKNGNVNTYAFDFNVDKDIFYSDHGVSSYFQHESTKSFIQKLLGIKLEKGYMDLCQGRN